MGDNSDFPHEEKLADSELDEHERFWNLVDRICEAHGFGNKAERQEAKLDVVR